MQISSNISNEEIKSLQKSFYEYFETGYAFEDFLKEYLLKMGLDEVEVTQRSRDAFKRRRNRFNGYSQRCWGFQ